MSKLKKKATNASGFGKLQLLLHGFCWLSVTVGVPLHSYRSLTRAA